MKYITFKQVLQYLRELEAEHGYRWAIRIPIEARMGGADIYCTERLTEGDKLLLDNLGLTYKFREDIQEWEINLIENE